MGQQVRTPMWFRGNFWLRAMVSVIGGALLIGVLVIGGWVYDLFVGLLMMTLIYEWCRLTRVRLASISGVALTTLLGFSFGFGISGGAPYFNILTLLAGLILLTILYFFVVSAQERPSLRWAGYGILYLGLPLIALIFIENIQSRHNFLTILWLFSVVWACDIGAYLVGSTLGGPKLWPKISPNKTWTGLVGGMMAAGITSSIWAAFYPQRAFLVYFIIGLIVALFAQAGDLLESKLKRHFGVKDSGNFIPGHGGVMDRFDGLLFVSPFVALYLYYMA